MSSLVIVAFSSAGIFVSFSSRFLDLLFSSSFLGIFLGYRHGTGVRVTLNAALNSPIEMPHSSNIAPRFLPSCRPSAAPSCASHGRPLRSPERITRRSSLSRPPESRDWQPFVRGRPCLAGSPPPPSSSRRFTDRELVAAEESESERSSRVPGSLALSLSLSSSLSLSLGRQGRPQWWTILLPPLLSVDDSRSLPPGKAVHVRYPLSTSAPRCPTSWSLPVRVIQPSFPFLSFSLYFLHLTRALYETELATLRCGFACFRPFLLS